MRAERDPACGRSRPRLPNSRTSSYSHKGTGQTQIPPATSVEVKRRPSVNAKRKPPVRAIRRQHTLNPVQRVILLPQIRQQRLVAERLTGHAPAQFPCAILLSLVVNLLVEPAFQSPKTTATEIAIEIAEILTRLLHELSRVESAECVRREIAEPAHAPVDVLQASLRVIRRRQIEHVAKLLVPR